MKFRIHFTLPDGSQDSITLTGETIDEIRQQAAEEISDRGGIEPWSEEL